MGVGRVKYFVEPFLARGWWRIIALWLLTLGMDTFYRGYGTIRAFLLVGVAALAVTCLRLIPVTVGSEPHLWLTRLVTVLLLAHVVYCGARLHDGHIGPIGAVTLEAAQLLARGENPYTANLDHDPIVEVGPAFGGYKYLPVMPLVYLPLGLIFGKHGMLLTNLLLDFAAAALIFLAARRDGDRTAGLIATAAYLSLPLVFAMLYAISTTDLVPVTLLLGSILANDRRPFTSGLLLGLSVASKLLPGLAAMPACMPQRGRCPFSLGFAAGLVPALLAFLSTPRAFLDNIVRFNFIRPVWSTSWLYGQPPWVSEASRVVFGLIWIGLAVFAVSHATRVSGRSNVIVLLLVAVFLAGPMMEQNYNLWWIPFLCVALAARTVSVSEAEYSKSNAYLVAPLP